MQILCTSYPFN